MGWFVALQGNRDGGLCILVIDALITVMDLVVVLFLHQNNRIWMNCQEEADSPAWFSDSRMKLELKLKYCAAQCPARQRVNQR